MAEVTTFFQVAISIFLFATIGFLILAFNVILSIWLEKRRLRKKSD
jgi:hypothetical protein